MKKRESVTADWLFVEKEGMVYGTKELRGGEKLLRIIDLQRIAGEVVEEGWCHYHDYLFKDKLVVQQGVFRWNSCSRSYRKVSDTYANISALIPLRYY